MSTALVDLDVTFETGSLRSAVQAVVPHADKDAEWPRLHRVRLYVIDGEALLVATDGQTAALARVDVVAQTEVLGCFDLIPSDAVEIARLFKPEKEAEYSAELRFEVSEKELKVTDVGGMFPGKSLTLNAVPVDDQFPNVALVLKKAMAAGDGFQPDEGYRTALGGRHLQKFLQAATAYGELLTLQPTGSTAALVVACGVDFVGLLVPAWQNPETRDRYGSTMATWLGRSEEVTRTHPYQENAATTSVIDVVQLAAALAGADGKAKPAKGKAAKAAAAAESDDEDEVPPDDEPDEVESVPMFHDGQDAGDES